MSPSESRCVRYLGRVVMHGVRKQRQGQGYKLKVEVDEVNGIVALEPEGPLTKDDFVSAANVIDPYIEDTGRLSGLAIHARAFPGWESFAALCSHLVFVKAHHRKISTIALCTNCFAAGFAQAIATHFVEAEIKAFPYQDLEQCKQ